MLEQLQSTLAFSGALRAAAAEVRCALLGVPLEVLQLPPTARDDPESEGDLLERDGEGGAGGDLVAPLKAGISAATSTLSQGMRPAAEGVGQALRKMSIDGMEYALGARPGRTRTNASPPRGGGVG